MPTIRTDDGIRLNYALDDFRDPWKRGGETILLHHGFGKSLKWWTQWVPALSRNYKVLRYDVRGCGESSTPAPGATWSKERMARDALNLIDELHIDKIHWVGFESGGFYGIEFAAAYPHRTSSLTVVGTPFSRSTNDLHRKYGLDIERLGIRRWVLEIGPSQIQLDTAAGAPSGLYEWMLSEMEKTPIGVATAIMNMVATSDFSGLPAQVLAPTLIMVGQESAICPANEQQEFKRQFPNARDVVFIAGVGTSAHLLMPDRCTHELLSFLETI